MPLASLRDLSRFPTSTLLPAITSTTASNTCTDSSSATSLDLGLGPSTQTKKWCFVAEITKVTGSEEYHTDLEVQDATGSRVRVVITAALEGFPRDRLTVGSVILVLGAMARELRDGGIGVEVSDVAKVKVCHNSLSRFYCRFERGEITVTDFHIWQTLPIQIDQFMNLNRNVLHYNSVEDAKGLCNGCLRRKASLHRCSGCRLFWYCNDVRQPALYTPLPSLPVSLNTSLLPPDHRNEC
jgi:hypothetical protein